MVKQLIPTEGLCYILIHCWETPQSPSFFKEIYNLRPDIISPMISKLKELKFLKEDVNGYKSDNRKRYYKTDKRKILTTIQEILKLSDDDFAELKTLINKLEFSINNKKIQNYIEQLDFSIPLDSFMQVSLFTVFLLFVITQENEKDENEEENDQEASYIDYVIRFTKNLFEQHINEQYFFEEVLKVKENDEGYKEDINYQLINRIFATHMFYRLFSNINPFEDLKSQDQFNL